jgi:putative nucleotidyltransferase with HDIG domain
MTNRPKEIRCDADNPRCTNNPFAWSKRTVDQLFTELNLSLAEVLSSLSFALDLTSGQSTGHAQRTCLIGMRLGKEYGLSETQMTSLYHALLIKDSGCSSNAARMFQIFGSDDIDAKRAIRITDWSNVDEALKFAAAHTLPHGSLLARAQRMQAVTTNLARFTGQLFETRCSRGANIARTLGLGEDAAQCIYCLDEHWNGQGMPHGMRGEQIPILARISGLAQTLEVFWRTFGLGPAFEVVRERSGRWFDPELVRVAHAFRQDDEFWRGVQDNTRQRLLRLNTGATSMSITPDKIDDVCDAFAHIVDAKSHFTGEHSSRVKDCALEIARGMGVSAERMTLIRRAALLHDIGKLSVPNTILDKPGPLDPSEWLAVKRHPMLTQQILGQITGFARLTEVAAAHHERLDGTGYVNGLRGGEIDQDMRILAVADVYDALSSSRPYRAAMPTEQVFSILDAKAHRSLDADCIAVLKSRVNGGFLAPPAPIPLLEEDDLLAPLPMAA